MAEIKFSQLTTAAQLTNDDIFALAQMQGGSLSSVKTSMIAVANFLNTQVQYTTAYNTQAKTTAGAINELRQLISLIPQFSIEVVEELPTEDISDTTIYLVPAEDPEVGNYYEEYIHVNDAWELVGTTAVDLSAYYTKLEVDGLLATKASVTEVALKENKSDMPTDVRTIIKDCKTPKNATITNGIAQFECIEENLVKGLKVTMNPIQDLHGYPNPWAGGAGKNKLCLTIRSASTVSGVISEVKADNNIVASGTAGTNADIICYLDTPTTLTSGNNYTFSLSGTDTRGGAIYLFVGTPDVNVGTINVSNHSVSFTPSSDIYLDKIRLRMNSGSVNINAKAMLESGSTLHAYEPYSNICPISGRTEASVTRTAGEDVETKTHQYSETIYGGVDDFVNGGATVNYDKITFDGTESWVYSVNRYQLRLNNIMKSGSYYNDDNVLCSAYPKSATLDVNNTVVVGYNSDYLYFYVTEDFPTLNDWKTRLQQGDIELTYLKSTATTISTSAEDITLLKGNNVLSTNADDMELKYSVSLDSLLTT